MPEWARRTLQTSVVVLAVSSVSGCMPVYTPLRSQSQIQLEADYRECSAETDTQSCMSARGYLVQRPARSDAPGILESIADFLVHLGSVVIPD